MNKHIIKTRRVGNSGSKYDLTPGEFEKDIEDKQAVGNAAQQTAESMIEAFLRADYRYRDGAPMCPAARWGILMDVLRDTKEKYGL